MKAKSEYKIIIQSKIFEVLYPNLTKDWKTDKKAFKAIIKQFNKKRKIQKTFSKIFKE